MGFSHNCFYLFIKRYPSSIEFLSFFIVVIALICSVIFYFFHLKLLNIEITRSIGVFFILYGIFSSIFLIFHFRKHFLLKNIKKASKYLSRIDYILIIILIICLFLLSITPVTDADSLDYHIGVPSSFYVYHTFLPRFDWFHSRLIGLGESINLIGLASWTDNLNSVLQFFGLISLLIVFWKHIQKKPSVQIDYKIFICKLLLGVPVLLFLLPNQKPQLIGTIAVLASMALCILEEKQRKLTCFLSVGALFFAFSLKYSFYVTGFIPFFFIGYTAYKNKLFKYFVYSSFFFYFMLLFPIHLFNYINYGNPVTPLFASLFKETGHQYLTSFNQMLSSYKEGFGFPFGLLIPNSPGKISTILGLGIFTFAFVDFKNKKSREVLILAFLTFITTVVFCQRTSRFFIDTYYITLLAFIVNPIRKKWFNLFDKLLTLQIIGVTACAVVGVYLLFPGSFSVTQREKVLRKSANEYSAMEYLDKKLPKDSFIISDFRSNALIPRNFVASNYHFMIEYYPKEFIKE